jgi:hypothetical protein
MEAPLRPGSATIQPAVGLRGRRKTRRAGAERVVNCGVRAERSSHPWTPLPVPFPRLLLFTTFFVSAPPQTSASSWSVRRTGWA